MAAQFVTLASLLAVLVAEPSSATSHRKILANRAAAQDDNRRFVPYEALRPVLSNTTSPAVVTAPKPAARHFARRRGLISHETHHHIVKRQVSDPRRAAHDWDNRLPKRATVSAVPTVCLGTQAAYGQCGGIGFTGDTCCISGFSCVVSDAYYSQCRPSTSTCSNALSGQCGGEGWTGSTCCPTGSACIAQSQFYSQCVIGATAAVPWVASNTSSTTTTTTTTTTAAAVVTTTPAATSCMAAYGQCGGTGWTGSTCCASGFSCTFSNSFYSQCLPAPVILVPAPSTTTPAAVTTTTSRSSSSSAAAASSTSAATTCTGMVSAWSQCAGSGVTYCCQSGYYCAYQSQFYSQCLAIPANGVPSTTTTTSASRTTTTTAPTATQSVTAPTCGGLVNLLLGGGQCGGLAYLGSTCCPSGYTCTATSLLSSTCQYTGKKCVVGGGGSDGCTPFTVTGSGVTLPLLQTFPSGGHVNYQAIPCSQYNPSAGQRYTNPGSNWTPMGFGTHFDPNVGQPGAKYIGKNFYDWGLAAAAFPSGFCVTWVQYSNANQHYGEGGQIPMCSSTCGK